ncbi:MAG: homogentisate 1,2-dioxygenase [Myxococcales bacterium]|nr:homogentisate 1,2-dioxygenase [Myxococcales bacterium]
MPYYVSRGSVPKKRHIVHRSPSGALFHEEHISRHGFSDIYTNAYHIHPPTRVTRLGGFDPQQIVRKGEALHRHHHLKTFQFAAQSDFISGRQALLFNSDCLISTVHPVSNTERFYRNAHADEMFFVRRGQGTLVSPMGRLAFQAGDYLVIPGGTLFQLYFEGLPAELLVLEANGLIETPRRYRNAHGQLLEHAPFCERDLRVPEWMEPIDARGEFEIVVKTRDGWQTMFVQHHPFDLVGWDGYYYPWAFDIREFAPIVGKVHQPPPVHQTFQAPGLVVCSFCPRLFDFHEEAIPAPYNHSNVDSDEVLYYFEGDFMSRRGISPGSITLHPAGLPHGPHPGLYEGSIGKKETREYAVMIDTFRPLHVAQTAMQVDDARYPYSWLE